MEVHHLNCGTRHLPTAPLLCHVLPVGTGSLSAPASAWRTSRTRAGDSGCSATSSDRCWAPRRQLRARWNGSVSARRTFGTSSSRTTTWTTSVAWPASPTPRSTPPPPKRSGRCTLPPCRRRSATTRPNGPTARSSSSTPRTGRSGGDSPRPRNSPTSRPARPEPPAHEQARSPSRPNRRGIRCSTRHRGALQTWARLSELPRNRCGVTGTAPPRAENAASSRSKGGTDRSTGRLRTHQSRSRGGPGMKKAPPARVVLIAGGAGPRGVVRRGRGSGLPAGW